MTELFGADRARKDRVLRAIRELEVEHRKESAG